MISIKFIRENIELVKESLNSRNSDIDLDVVLDIDETRRHIIKSVESLKADRNYYSKEIAKQKQSGEDCSDQIQKMQVVSKSIKDYDLKLNQTNDKLKELLLFIPNIPHSTTPRGKSEDDNVIVKTWGKKPDFNFDCKGHVELAEKYGLVDFKRGAKISGSGYPLYVNKGARLERALINYMMNKHASNGYNEVFPPFLVNESSVLTTGQLPKFKEDMYYVDKDDMYCISTAEVPVTNIHKDDVLNEEELPKKYVAYSACFRREAGSYGKDTRGLLRLHQFNKVELVKFVNSDVSYQELDSLLIDAEEILQSLNLHYRVIELCTSDLSFSAAKCYDIEVWSPFEKKYLEVSSCSNFESFQSIRGNIRFKNNNNKLQHVHTLNGSGLATPRLFVAILENYQQEDGSILVPEVLQEYTSFGLIC